MLVFGITDFSFTITKNIIKFIRFNLYFVLKRQRKWDQQTVVANFNWYHRDHLIPSVLMSNHLLLWDGNNKLTTFCVCKPDRILTDHLYDLVIAYLYTWCWYNVPNWLTSSTFGKNLKKKTTWKIWTHTLQKMGVIVMAQFCGHTKVVMLLSMLKTKSSANLDFTALRKPLNTWLLLCRKF